jgi:hypothetical protein
LPRISINHRYNLNDKSSLAHFTLLRRPQSSAVVTNVPCWHLEKKALWQPAGVLPCRLPSSNDPHVNHLGDKVHFIDTAAAAMTAAGSRRGTAGAKRSVLRSVSVALYNAAAAAALSCFVAGISAAVFLVAACVAALIFAPGSAATWALLAFALFVTFVPLWERNGPPADAFMRFCCFSAGDYFSIRVLVESGAEYSAARSYVVGAQLLVVGKGRPGDGWTITGSCAATLTAPFCLCPLLLLLLLVLL